MGAFFKFLLGKEVGAFTKGLVGRSFAGAFKGTMSQVTAHNAWHALKMQLYIGLPLTLLAPGTPEEKAKGLAMNVAAGFLTMGMNSTWRQFGWNAALSLLPHFGGMTRGIVQGYRGALEARTSLAIPFSHSSMAMDQAFATMQYSQSRMSEAYSNLNGQAAFFAARFMSR